MDKSDELKVFGYSPPRRKLKRDGVDSVRALILRSSFSISTAAGCFIGNSKLRLSTF